MANGVTRVQILNRPAEDDIELPKEDLSRRAYRWGMWAVVLLILAWGYLPAEVYRFVNLFTDASNMAEYASGFLSPDFHDWDYYVAEMILTVQIAFWGTFLSVVVGIPFSLLSSNNMAPIWIVQPTRRLMDACRAINELVFAVLFVVAGGIGYILFESIRSFQYSQTAAIILVVVVTVSIVDIISQQLRKVLV